MGRDKGKGRGGGGRGAGKRMQIANEEELALQELRISEEKEQRAKRRAEGDEGEEGEVWFNCLLSRNCLFSFIIRASYYYSDYFNVLINIRVN